MTDSTTTNYLRVIGDTDLSEITYSNDGQTDSTAQEFGTYVTTITCEGFCDKGEPDDALEPLFDLAEICRFLSLLHTRLCRPFFGHRRKIRWYRIRSRCWVCATLWQRFIALLCLALILLSV